MIYITLLVNIKEINNFSSKTFLEHAVGYDYFLNMKNMLILAHPDKNSFQNSLASSIQDELKRHGQQVFFSNLYEESFPAILPKEEIQRGCSSESLILRHQNALKNSNRLLLFCPDWWGLPPAILKGWLDRILAPEVAYRWEGEDFLEKNWIPLLKDLQVKIFISADNKLNQNWLQQLWQDRIFSPCGAKTKIHYLDQMRNRSRREISEWISRQIDLLML